VDPAVLDRAPGRHEGLPRHLATEDALAFFVGLDAAEDIHLDGFEIQQVDEELEGSAHAPMFAGRRHHRRPTRARRSRYRAPP
jgi:hypothetical protein